MTEQNEKAYKCASGGGETLEAVRERAKAAQEAPPGVRSQAGAAVRDGTGRPHDHLRRAAVSLLHEQQERIADAAHDLAEALRQTAVTLERDDKATAARYADQAAAQIDRVSEAMRNRHFSDLMAGAEIFERRHRPFLFVAGAAAVGFVIGRVLTRPARNDSRPTATP